MMGNDVDNLWPLVGGWHLHVDPIALEASLTLLIENSVGHHQNSSCFHVKMVLIYNCMTSSDNAERGILCMLEV